MKPPIKRVVWWAGLLLCSAVGASANSIVTFQVDMSQAVADSAFDPATQTVAARGSFSGWNAFPLTNNPAGPNPNLWTGTTNITDNGTVMQYKYAIEPGAQYETVFLAGGHNRLATLPAASGGTLVLPKVFYSDATDNPVTVSVTFQVNLAQQINTGAFRPGTDTAQARGIFDGWGGSAFAQTNDPSILTTNQNGLVSSNVYVYTYDITGSPGQTIDYKYFIDNGGNWESPAPNTGDPADNNNRFFNLGAGATQTLPIVYFGDSPYAPLATNAVTFQVDLTAEIQAGNFDPSSGGVVEVRGDFNGWGTPQIILTNDVAAANTNIYRNVVTILDGVGATRQYKFWATVPNNGGWETQAANRSFRLVNATSLVLPLVFFDNLDPNDFLPADTLVTFSVNMTNAVGNDAHTFDPSADQVYLNGVPNGFAAWDTGLPQLTNNPIGSQLYSLQVLLPKGTPVKQTYKYGINGVDDEAASGANHIRYVRTTGTYVFPRDTFGNQYVEPSFGQLTIGSPVAGRAPISWLGRPGVHLQVKSDLASGSWQDLLNTDGSVYSTGTASTNGLVSVTNYPTAGSKAFLRLIQQ